MLRHSSFALLFVTPGDASGYAPLLDFLRAMPHVRLTHATELPRNLDEFDTIVTAGRTAGPASLDALNAWVQAGRGWLMLDPKPGESLPELFGVRLGDTGPVGELRVLFTDPGHPLAVRLPDAVYLQGRHQPMEVFARDADVVLYADWHYRHNPVLVQRPAGQGRVAVVTLADVRHPVFRQILYRVLDSLAGRPPTADRCLGVGILGYAPSMGEVHGRGAELTHGLSLRAVCDTNPHRLAAARQDFAEVKVYESAAAFAKDPDIDVVVIATPPNTHAELSLQMMAADKHVVCEKPLALNRRETQAMVALAENSGLHLSCCQNRRWDVDYLAIRQALSEGLIGDLFYLETFVGGFSHPCGYWHSHAAVSGGTAYDWGAHYLDWIVSLIPEPVTSVRATRHKRVWHDVTNFDQEKIHLHFVGGQEAEFLHSDIAAVRKPKWYLLGTQGALIGRWRDVDTYLPDPLLYFDRHEIPATEMPPDLTLYRRHASGQIVPQSVAQPERRHYLFHQNLADHLLTGEPIAAPLEDSVKVVAILEAAGRSAAAGGRLEVIGE